MITMKPSKDPMKVEYNENEDFQMEQILASQEDIDQPIGMPHVKITYDYQQLKELFIKEGKLQDKYIDHPMQKV